MDIRTKINMAQWRVWPKKSRYDSKYERLTTFDHVFLPWTCTNSSYVRFLAMAYEREVNASKFLIPLTEDADSLTLAFVSQTSK